MSALKGEEINKLLGVKTYNIALYDCGAMSFKWSNCFFEEKKVFDLYSSISKFADI